MNKLDLDKYIKQLERLEKKKLNIKFLEVPESGIWQDFSLSYVQNMILKFDKKQRKRKEKIEKQIFQIKRELEEAGIDSLLYDRAEPKRKMDQMEIEKQRERDTIPNIDLEKKEATLEATIQMIKKEKFDEYAKIILNAKNIDLSKRIDEYCAIVNEIDENHYQLIITGEMGRILKNRNFEKKEKAYYYLLAHLGLMKDVMKDFKPYKHGGYG